MSDASAPTLSVLMPVYNERDTVLTAIDRLAKADLGIPVQLVIVNDGSTDGTTQILTEHCHNQNWITLHHHPHNQGKGKAIQTALQHAQGHYSCIYDADLEYDPQDMKTLLQPLQDSRTDVVYGTRAFGGHAAHSYWYVLGNRAMTTACNLIYNCYLRDIMTCYKMMETHLYRSLNLQTTGFDLEAEITAKLLRRNYRIYEVPITYRARTHQEGKKLGTSAAWGVLAVLAKTRYGTRALERAKPSTPASDGAVLERSSAGNP